MTDVGGLQTIDCCDLQKRCQCICFGGGLARKRHSYENVLMLLRGIELKMSVGNDVASVCH